MYAGLWLRGVFNHWGGPTMGNLTSPRPKGYPYIFLNFSFREGFFLVEAITNLPSLPDWKNREKVPIFDISSRGLRDGGVKNPRCSGHL